LAHHADDQAETVAFRRARRSGPDGLAGMPAVREVPGLRLLRPLLGVPKARLIATLETARQPWLDDPSNRAVRFARGRLRLGPAIDAPALCAIAASAAGARTRLDRAVAAWLVETTRIDPAGFALLARTALRNAAPELARRALQQILATIGGGAYPPRQARLGGLLELVRSPAGSVRRTLAGCRILDHGDALLFCREAGAIRHIAPLRAQESLVWDDRYVLQARPHGMSPEPGLSVGALGRSSRAELSAMPLDRRAPRRRLPGAVLPSLPALWQGTRLVAVPHLSLCVAELAAASAVEIRFQPRHPLAAASFGGPR
jgi:tRNA(Ile)-lysidine synthase